MAQRILYLVRHAQYDHADREDGALTALGVEQAQVTGRALAGLPLTRMHYSTVRRAVETADSIADALPDLPRQPTDLLRECIPPMHDHLLDFFALRGPFTSRHQMEQCAARIDAAYSTYAVPPASQTEDEHDLLICHGNVIRYLVAKVVGAPSTAWTQMLINNCGVTRLVINEGGEVFLLAFNDTGHLPPPLLTDH